MTPTYQQTTLEANAPDAWGRFFDNLTVGAGIPAGQRVEVVEGIFNIQDAAGALYSQLVGTPPPVAQRGTEYPAGSFEGWGGGNKSEVGAALRLDQLWIREVVAAGGSRITFRGVLRLLDG